MLISFFCILLLVKYGHLAVSQKDIDIFVNYHNEVRAGVKPKARSMPKVKWNTTLEDLATEWQKKCIFDHPKPDDPKYSPYGQNWWMDYYTDPKKPYKTVDTMVRWYEEYKFFTYPTTCASGEVCGHYTQMIWADTLLIGCYTGPCKTEEMFGVCQYYPRGNYIDQAPYVAKSTLIQIQRYLLATMVLFIIVKLGC